MAVRSARPGRRIFNRELLGRALFPLSLVVLAVGTLVFLADTFNEGPKTPLPPVPQPQAERVSQVIQPEARAVAVKFIATAVARRNLAASWPLVHPALRMGLTKKQWLTGDIPVTPIDMSKIDVTPFKVDDRFPGGMTLEVAFVPKPGVKMKSVVFDMGLRNIGSRARPRWVVDYWMPHPNVPVPTDPNR